MRIFGMLYGARVSGRRLLAPAQLPADRLRPARRPDADARRRPRGGTVAHIPRLGQASAVRTRNPVLALVTQEYLHHDIVLQRAQLQIGFDEWDRWWQADPDLRTLILGRSLETDERSDAPARKKEEVTR